MVKIRSKNSKTKIEKIFKYFFCTKEETQPSLLAGLPDVKVDVSVGDVHIVYQGRLMCGESMEALKNRSKADNGSIVETLPKNVPMCSKCAKKYKENPESPWYKWLDSSSPF